jgi:hypothetical protein
VGESLTLPDACELVVTVREPEPVEAVIVTDVAFVVCQFKVTLCPAVIAVAFAEKARVGIPEPLPGLEAPAQAQRAKSARSMIPKETRRSDSWFISFQPYLASLTIFDAELQMLCPTPELP